MDLEQPVGPSVGDVGEDRHRPDEVEGAIVDRERRDDVVSETVKRRTEGRAQPLDALWVDVATPQVRRLRLDEEVAQRPTGSAAEVEHPLALEGPVARQALEDDLAQAPADREVVLVGLAAGVADPDGEIQRR